MKKIRGMIALLVSLVLAGGAALGVYRYLGKPSPEKVQPVAVVKQQKQAQDLPPLTFSQSIPAGMRAVTLSIDLQKEGVGNFAKGDTVDVLVVSPIPNIGEGRVSRLLMSGARILEMKQGESAGGRKSRNMAVTLLVTPSEAAALEAAGPAATLRLVMRNPDDKDTTLIDATAFIPANGVSPYLAQKRDLNSLIAPGMRALTLTVGPTDGVGGVFFPDDRVDVVVTCPWGNISLKAQDKPGEDAVLKETHRNSRIMLQNIRIVATDKSLVWQNSQNIPTSRVTLEVTPEDAEKLTVLADSKKGKSIIRLISRNQNDKAVVSTEGAELIDLLSERRAYMQVEIIRGPLRKDQTFYK